MFLGRGRARQVGSIRAGGFTLVELLVVIAIIGTLVGLLLPAVQAARESARRSQCGNNVKQLGLALLNFNDANRYLPYASKSDWNAGRETWFHQVLPYLEERALSDRFATWRAANPGTEAFKWSGAVTPVSGLSCPSNLRGVKIVGSMWAGFPGFHGTYALCAGSDAVTQVHYYENSVYRTLNGMFYTDSKTQLKHVTDGLSKTVMGTDQVTVGNEFGDDNRGFYWNGTTLTNVVMTTALPPNTATKGDAMENCMVAVGAPCEPVNYTSNPANFNRYARSYHNGGAQAVMADGSVRFVVNEVDPITWQRAGSRADGQAQGDF
ncbi:MAG: DUF1559 domain-containing protein [Planctomycetia bacterium]